MIAIVILGIGLVMVATIFPVAVVQTREAVELSLAPAVADQAVAILKARLATWNDFDANGQIDFPGGVTSGQAEAEGTGPAGEEWTVAAQQQSDWPNDPFGMPAYQGYFPIPCENFTRMPVPNPGGDTLANYFANGMAITENRNDLSLDTDQAVAHLVAIALEAANPQVPPPPPTPVPQFARTKITAFDRVYPLGERTLPDGTGQYPPTFAQALEDRFMADAARRRYAWKAFALRTGPATADQAAPASVAQRVFEVAVFALKRSSPGLRFAGQQHPVNDGLCAGLPVLCLADPATAAATRDTLFPQPWLVFFDTDGAAHLPGDANPDANYAAGIIRCLNPGPATNRAGVARLLPPGAIFIDFVTGTPHKVLSRTFGDDAAGTPDVLQIAPEPNSAAAWDPAALGGTGGLKVGSDFAWVFPPAIDPTSNLFTNDSPVVEVFRATIAVGGSQ